MMIEGAASLAAAATGTAALEAALGFALPAPRRRRAEDGMTLLWVGPERWLALADRAVAADLARRAGAAGSVTDQSDSRAALHLAGPAVRDVLAKGVPIDLHPKIFAEDEVAVTLAGHVGVVLWRLGEDAFGLACARSYAGSLAAWLIASAAEFGLSVTPAIAVDATP